MDLSDRRVVQFREWAERRFAIGSGGYGEAEDLLSVVMRAVEARERNLIELLYESGNLGHSEPFEAWLKKAVDE